MIMCIKYNKLPTIISGICQPE